MSDPMRVRRMGFIGVAVVSGALPSQPLRTQSPVRRPLLDKLEGCRVPGLDEDVLCGRHEVPENRAEANGRRLSLNIVVLPATTDSVLADPLVFLAGGGVVPATRSAPFLARSFARLRRNRDILLVDQRGTWGSNPLTCDPPPVTGGPPNEDAVLLAARRCGEALATRTDLGTYSTVVAMDDLDAVRAWLGYPRISIFGVSYGTKAAQVYLRAYGDRVRVAALHGVVPVSRATQLDLAASAQASLDEVVRRCSRDAACGAAFPNFGSEFDALLERLAGQPQTVSLNLPAPAPSTVLLTHRAVRNFVQTALGSARSIRELPLLIHLAHERDYRPLAQRVIGGGPPPAPPAPLGVFLSILCNEEVARIDPARVDSATKGTFFGSEPVRFQINRCAGWPRASLPSGFWDPVTSSVNALVLSGDLDAITPPSYGEALSKSLRNARHVVLPNRSHNDADACVTSLVEQFVIDGRSDRLDTRCLTTAGPLRFMTRPEDLLARP